MTFFAGPRDCSKVSGSKVPVPGSYEPKVFAMSKLQGVVPVRVVGRIDVVRAVSAGGDEENVRVTCLPDLVKQGRVVREFPRARTDRIAATVRVAEDTDVRALGMWSDPGAWVAAVPD